MECLSHVRRFGLFIEGKALWNLLMRLEQSPNTEESLFSERMSSRAPQILVIETLL